MNEKEWIEKERKEKRGKWRMERRGIRRKGKKLKIE